MPEKPTELKPASSTPPAPAAAGTQERASAPPAPEPPSALEKRAAELEARLQAEEEKAAELAAVAQKAAEAAEDEDQPRVARCPTCRSRLERYQGSNPHKQGSSFCPTCGRIRVEHGKVVG